VEAAERALAIAQREAAAGGPPEIADFMNTVEQLRVEAAKRAAAQPPTVENGNGNDDAEGDDGEGDAPMTEGHDE
jgi:hypothetical protein